MCDHNPPRKRRTNFQTMLFLVLGLAAGLISSCSGPASAESGVETAAVELDSSSRESEPDVEKESDETTTGTWRDRESTDETHNRESTDGNHADGELLELSASAGTIECEHLNEELSAEERLAFFRAERDAYIGFDSDIVRGELRVDGLSLVQIAARYGMSDTDLLEAAEIFHSTCYQREVDAGNMSQTQAHRQLETTMERFSSLMGSLPCEGGFGAGIDGVCPGEETDTKSDRSWARSRARS